MTEQRPFRVGDKVTIQTESVGKQYPGVWIVTKIKVAEALIDMVTT